MASPVAGSGGTSSPLRLLPLTLPHDIWLHLVRYLPLSSILSLSRSCHGWRHHCRSDGVWTLLRARDLPQLDGEQAQRIHEALIRAKDHHELAALLVDEIPVDALHTLDWVHQWNDRPAYIAPPMFHGVHLWALWRTIPSTRRGLPVYQPTTALNQNTSIDMMDAFSFASRNVPSLLNEMQFETISAANSSESLAIKNNHPDNHFKPAIDFTLFGARGDAAWQPSEAATAATRRQVGRRGRMAQLGIPVRNRPRYNYAIDNEISQRQPSITSNYRPSSAPSMMSAFMNNNNITNIGSAPPTGYGVAASEYPASPVGSGTDSRRLAFAPNTYSPTTGAGRTRRPLPFNATNNGTPDGSPGGRPIVYRLAVSDTDDPQSIAAISGQDGKRLMPALPEEAHYEPSEWIPADEPTGHTLHDGETTPRGTAGPVSVVSMAPPMIGNGTRGTHMAPSAWTVGTSTPMTVAAPASIMDTVVAMGHNHRHDDMVQVPDHVVSVLQDKEWSPTPGVFVLESTLCKAKALYMAHHLCDMGYTVISSLQLRDLTLTWRYLLLLMVPASALISCAIVAFIILLSSKVNAINDMSPAMDISWSYVFMPIYATTIVLTLYAIIICSIGRFCPRVACCRRRPVTMISSMNTSSLLVDPSLESADKRAAGATMKKKLGNAIAPLQVTVAPTPYMTQPHRRILPPSEDSHQELDSPETRVFTWLYRSFASGIIHTIAGILVALLPAVSTVLISMILNTNDNDNVDTKTMIPVWSVFLVALIWVVAFTVWLRPSSHMSGKDDQLPLTPPMQPQSVSNWRRHIRRLRAPVNVIITAIWLLLLWQYVETSSGQRKSAVSIMMPLWLLLTLDGLMHWVSTTRTFSSREIGFWSVRYLLVLFASIFIAALINGVRLNAHLVSITLYPLVLYYSIGMMMVRLSMMRHAFMCHLYLKGVPHFWSKSHLTSHELDTIKQRLLSATARYTAELGQHNV